MNIRTYLNEHRLVLSYLLFVKFVILYDTNGILIKYRYALKMMGGMVFGWPVRKILKKINIFIW